jgi:hypothetical protein
MKKNWCIVICLQKHALKILHSISVQIFILAHAIMKCFICIIEVELGVVWIIFSIQSKSSSEMINCVSGFPHPQTVTSFIDSFIFHHKGHKCKGRVILLNREVEIMGLHRKTNE